MHLALLIGLAACSGDDRDRTQGPAGTSGDGTDADSDATPTDDTEPPLDTGTPPSAPLIRFASGTPPRNVLMLSIDTLRRDHLDRYAPPGTPARMPFLSGLADAGFAMDDFQACASWTLPATACVLGGRDVLELAEETGVLPQVGLRPGAQGTYPAGTPFLSTWLTDTGRYGILVSANEFLGPRGGQTPDLDEVVIRHFARASRIAEGGAATLAAAIDRGDTDQGWFLHLHFMDPHKPYDPPEAYLDALDALDPLPWDLTDNNVHDQLIWAMLRGQVAPDMAALALAHMRARYAAETRWLDDALAAAWATFDQAGWLDDTLVVVWTDHGEQFWEHGNLAHAKLHHPEEKDAIWFLWAEDLVPGSTDLPAHGTDLAPTLLQLLGAPRPAAVTGLAVDDIPAERVRHATSIGFLGPVQSVERGTHKMQFVWADPAQNDEWMVQLFSGRLSFFDLAADPDELQWQGDPDDPDVLALWALLRPRVERAAPFAAPYGFVPRWPPDLP